MQNGKILDFLRDILSKISYKESSEVAKKFATTTKRFANMIMADGLINALLFAYNKAKYNEVKNIVASQKQNQKIEYIKDDTVDTSRIWATLIWITIKILKKREIVNIDADEPEEYDPLTILEEIEKNFSPIVVGYLIKHLDLLAKIFDAHAQ